MSVVAQRRDGTGGAVSAAMSAPASRVPASATGIAPPVRFVLVTLLACLLLQRFALPVAGLKVSVATPIVLGLAGWELYAGRLGFDRIRLALLLGFFAVAMMSVAVQANAPLNMVIRSSLSSLAYGTVVTAFVALTFRTRMPERDFYRLANRCLAVVAVAGIVQFVAQFANISIFSFSDFVPDSLLIEEQYALKNLVGGTALYRSNGFFLVEASVFSQFMSVGLIIEVLYFRRTRFMMLFLLAELVAVSGTGWIVLGVFIAQLAFVSGLRGAMAAGGLVLLVGGGFVSLLLLAPDFANNFLGRFNEINQQGTSGYERFVTPFMALRRVTDIAPHVWVTGIGPGAADWLALPFFYVMDTPVKIMLEYGVVGLLLYLALFVSGRRTSRQRALVLPLMALYLFTGGYQQFTPVLFPIVLLMTVANLEEQP